MPRSMHENARANRACCANAAALCCAFFGTSWSGPRRPGQLQIAVLTTSLSETYCGRWIVACYRAHPVADRCCIPCPKSRGRTELLARPQRLACHFPFAFSLATTILTRAARFRTADSLLFICAAMWRGLHPMTRGLVCARLHMASKHGRQISFPLRLQPRYAFVQDSFSRANR